MKRMSAIANGSERLYEVVDTAPVQILRMTRTVQRAAAIVHCDDGRPYANSQHILDGGLYAVYSRREGFPPHMG